MRHSFFESLELVFDARQPKEFLSKVFEKICLKEKKQGAMPWLDRQGTLLESTGDKSTLQDQGSIRNVHQARCLAIWLVDDQGHVEESRVLQAKEQIEKKCYPLGPEGSLDACRNQHFLRVLNWLLDKKFLVEFHRLAKPQGNPLAEELIRYSLVLPAHVMIDDAQTKRAVLSAWLTYLRQNVGSCFATAPVLLVLHEQPWRFLQDMQQLLAQGQITRVVAGSEFSVPLSPSWGAGDLKKTIPLVADSPLWQSKSFLAACEAAELFKEVPTQEKPEESLRRWALAAIPALAAASSPLMSSPEWVLKKMLLSKYGLTEEEERIFEKRSQTALATPLDPAFSRPPSKTPTRGGMKSYGQYIEQFDRAKKAFKACADNALLKAWEFTVASFAETKSDFVSWNLYASLGLASTEPDGVGQKIREFLEAKLEHYNRIVEECQERHEQFYYYVRHLEARMRTAPAAEIEWLRSEYQTRVKEYEGNLAQRDDAHERAHRLSQGLVKIVQVYEGLFKTYFQEIYDADMHDHAKESYDDSPAGFRLLYKHGRRQTSSWTMIYNEEDFSRALADFFSATEREVIDQSGLEDLAQDLSMMITELVLLVKSKEFLAAACRRVAKVYGLAMPKDPLKELDRLERKPWSYISGGTMAGLVRTYYGRQELPTEKKSWVESPEELAVFFINAIKELSGASKQMLLKEPYHGILAYSPTHAFVVKPDEKLFSAGWHDESYTYTWLRDVFVVPRKNFWQKLTLSRGAMEKVGKGVAEHLGPGFQKNIDRCLADLPTGMSSIDFRKQFLQKLQQDRLLHGRWQGGVLDVLLESVLFQTLPCSTPDQLKKALEGVGEALQWTALQKKQGLHVLASMGEKMGPHDLFSAQEVLEVAKSFIILVEESSACSYDVTRCLVDHLEKMERLSPSPLVFADSNWLQDLFAFVVSPGTGALELWCLYHSQREGRPIAEWKKWTDGSRKESWGTYPVLQEYQGNISSSYIIRG